jgi:hypothetical protein
MSIGKITYHPMEEIAIIKIINIIEHWSAVAEPSIQPCQESLEGAGVDGILGNWSMNGPTAQVMVEKALQAYICQYLAFC